MAEKIRYEVDVDSSDAKRGLQDFSRAAKKAGKDASSALDDTASAGDKARAAIKQMADTMDSELRASAKAADALGQALGPELAGRVDLDKMVADLGRMGVSLDEVTADADKFADTLRQVDGVRLQQVNDGLGTTGERMRAAGAGTDKLSDSARGANSALANMLGNSAQDLGALGGVAGSAGVAIGQMAEYAADAALGGEALGASLKSMAAVAGPIAALSAGMLALQGIMALIRRDDGLTAEEVAAVTEALADQIGVLDEYQSAVSSAFGQGTADTIEVFTEAVFKAIEATKGDTFITDLETSLGRLGAVRRDFGEIAAQSQQDQAAWLADLLNLHGVVPSVAADIADYYAGLSNGTQATVDWARANPDLADSFLVVSTALGEARRDSNAATQDFLDNQASINDGTKALVAAAVATAAAQADATGAQFNWNDALQVYIGLQQQLLQIGGAVTAVTEQQAEATEATQEALEEQTTAIGEGIQAWKEHTTAVQEAAIAIEDILEQVPDLAGGLAGELDKVDKLFEGLKFDVDFETGIRDALDDLHGFKPDFQTLADEWAGILAGQPIDIFGNVRADDSEFLDKVANLRNLIQEGIVNEFEQGGKDAADTFLQSNAARIAASSGLSIGEVYRIMGLPPDGSIETIIEPIVDADHADKARGILDALAGVAGGEDREALIHVALETGDIDGDIAFIAAQLLAEEELGIPAKLEEFSAEDVALAQAFLDGQVFTASITPDVPPAEQNRTDQILEGLADERTAPYRTETPDAAATNKRLDGVALGILGAIWPGGAGRLATYRTEAPGLSNLNTLLNAVATPPGSGGGRATWFFPFVNEGSRANAVRTLDNVANPGGQPRVAHITVETVTVGGGSSGPKIGGQSAEPAAAATTAAPVRTPSAVTMAAAPASTFNANFTIHTGVLGNHFDVERTITRAFRRAARINGRRAVNA